MYLPANNLVNPALGLVPEVNEDDISEAEFHQHGFVGKLRQIQGEIVDGKVAESRDDVVHGAAFFLITESMRVFGQSQLDAF